MTVDADVVYVAAGLLPGRYRLDLALPGFKPVRQGISLSTGTTVRVDFDLLVGGVSELVTVAADAPMLRTETASLGALVSQEQIVRVPLNGRTSCESIFHLTGNRTSDTPFEWLTESRPRLTCFKERST